MISSLRGPVRSIGLDHAVVEVGGVGFTVYATPSTLATLRRGTETTLTTTLIVREDALTLYGFADAEARDLFGLLLTVSGIGPRLALATLAVLEPEKLRSAIAESNIAVLTQIPGVGKKSAERLVIELRDKVGALSHAAGAGAHDTRPDRDRVRSEVVEALAGLGFPAKQAEQAVRQVLEDGESDTSAVLRGSLAILGRKR